MKDNAQKLGIDAMFLLRKRFILGIIPAVEEIDGKKIMTLKFVLFEQTEFAMIMRARKTVIESKEEVSLESALDKVNRHHKIGSTLLVALLALLFLPVALSFISMDLSFSMLVFDVAIIIPLTLYTTMRKQEKLIRDFYALMSISQHIATANGIEFPAKEYRLRRIGGILLFISIITAGLFVPLWLGIQVWRWNRAIKNVREITAFLQR